MLGTKLGVCIVAVLEYKVYIYVVGSKLHCHNANEYADVHQKYA